MNEEIRSAGQTIQAILCIGISIPMLILGVGFTAGYPSELWWLGPLLLISGALLIHSGVTILRKIRRDENVNIDKVMRMQQTASLSVATARTNPHQQPATEELSDPHETVLAKWNFTADEWARFAGKEKEGRVKETVLLIVLSTFVFGWVIHGLDENTWTFSLTFGFCFAAFFFGVKFLLSQRSIAVSPNVPVEVLIDYEKISINGKLFYFVKDERSLKNVEVIEKNQIKILRIAYQWRTSKGAAAEDDVMVPVPRGEEQSAYNVMARLMVSKK